MTRFLAFSTFALLLLTTTPAASFAQTASNEFRQPWTRVMPNRLAMELASDDLGRQGDAMLKVIQYSTFIDGSIQWAPVVKPLLAIYKTDVDYRNRRLAVAALHATGHPKGMKALRSLVYKESSPAVVTSTIMALVDHYGLGAFQDDRKMARLAERTLTTGRKTGFWATTADRQ
jgi:hypothetical protein